MRWLGQHHHRLFEFEMGKTPALVGTTLKEGTRVRAGYAQKIPFVEFKKRPAFTLRRHDGAHR